MPGTDWLLLSLTVDATDAEIAMGLLWDLEPAGLQEIESGRAVRLEAYFPAQTASGDLAERAETKARRMSLAIEGLSVEPFRSDADDWIVNWKKNFRGSPIGELFYVHPPREDPDAAYPFALKIEPSHAFGTGTHESTQLCVRLLQDEAQRRERMLDVGTGSGILAAAASKLNTDLKVFAFDNDPRTAEVAQRLLVDNRLKRVGLFTGEIGAVRGPFDLVTANLTLDIFRRVATDLIRISQDRLILSGFTADQRDDVLRLFHPHGFRRVGEKELNSWVGLTLRAPVAS